MADPKPPSSATAPSPSVLKGASLLIILQVASRLLTFLANQLLLRYLTAPLLGISAQLEVYYLSVLFFARESLRVAIQRQGIAAPASQDANNNSKEPKNGKAAKDIQAQQQQQQHVIRESQAVVNLGYLSLPLGLLTSLLLGWSYLRYTPAALLSSTPHLRSSLYVYATASLLELLSEPCFVLMQTRLRFGTRATAESAATFLRCGVVFATAVLASQRGQDVGVLPFALGQLTYGSVLLAVYLAKGWGLAREMGFSLLPRGVAGRDFALGGLFYKPTVRLAGSMMAQSLVKHVLTQGDTFLVSLLSTPDVQGVYALANNYGGLLARLLFQPVEESSRSYFSRLLANAPPTATAKKGSQSGAEAEHKDSNVNKAKRNLQLLLQTSLFLSLPILAFGPVASSALLSIVAGRAWSLAASPTLALYTLYIPLLSLNGLTESFVASVATEAQIHAQSAWMGGFSGAFAGCAWLFMGRWGWGARGLVAANMVNMACRIVWSVWFIEGWFQARGGRFGAWRLVPWGGLVLAGATPAMMGVLEERGMGVTTEENPFVALVKIGAVAVPFVMVLAFIERHFLMDVYSAFVRKKKTE